METTENIPDAFVFHGFSYNEERYNLIIEIYDDHTPVYKTALAIIPGENLYVLNREQLSLECWTANHLVKVYPENDMEAELDLFWCDFVCGKAVTAEKPADKVKCVVWDLDNTVWDGTLIETDDPKTLNLKTGVLETIQELDRRGIIQSIASKNDMEVAWPVVEDLGIAEYFLYPQIHWNAKSSSMEQIAKCLNIGIDTLALIDDSSFEREQVKSVWPQIRVFDATEVPQLLEKPEVTVMVTEESKNRRAMYQAEEKRNQLKNNGNADTIAFLKKCHLQIKIFKPETETEILRCYELIIRTNQLNMSGKKYSKEEFAEVLQRPEHKSFAFSCWDDFGEYGIVGFGQYRVNEKQIIFTEFAMSCRVARKYVESALFAFLLKYEKCQSGKFAISITKKNILLRNTLKEIGFSIESETSARVCYQFGNKLLHSELVEVKGDGKDD
ncbi:MAG: HAD-IIIC family phosphatase [Lachnospiraceae bacterium]